MSPVKLWIFWFGPIKMMGWRILLLLLLLGLLPGQAVEAMKTKTPTMNRNPPNILMFVADDMKQAVISGYGESTLAKTPNIDALMQRGISFRNAMCQEANCSPSRSSFLTSMRPDYIGVTNDRELMRARHGDAIITLPEHFKNVGYKTVAAVGKIFDGRSTGGHSVEDYPLSWTVVPYNNYNNLNYVTDPAEIGNCGYGDFTGKKPMSQCITFRPTPAAANLFYDGKDATEAIIRLDPKNKLLIAPWFFAFGLGLPHLPWSAPQYYWEEFNRNSFKSMADVDMTDPVGPVYNYAYEHNDEIASYGGFPNGAPLQFDPPLDVRLAVYHGYYAGAAFADSQFARVMAAFYQRSPKEVNNTIIVFTTDHGFFLGEKSIFGKHNVYEQDTKVPLIIVPPIFDPENRYPTLGVISDAPVELLDLYPTLMEMTGTGDPSDYHMFDGISMVPILEKPTKSLGLKLFAVSQHPAYIPGIMSYSLRTWSHRYVFHIQGDASSGPIIGTELYNYQTDPREIVNQVDNPAYSHIVSLFQGYLSKYKSIRWQGIAGSPPFDAPSAG